MAVVRIECEFDARGAIVSTRTLSDEFKKVPSSIKPASDAVHNLGKEHDKAKEAIELLGRQLGIEIPRGARSFIASISGIGPALSAAFNASAVVAVGFALFESGKRLYEWIEGAKEASEETKKLNEEVKKLNESYEQYLDKMERLQRAKGLAGLEGSAKTGQEFADLKRDLDRAKIEFGDLSAKYNRLYLDSTRSGYTASDRDKRDAAIAELARGKEEGADIISQTAAARQKYDQLKVEVETKSLELNKQITEEKREQTEEAQKQYEAYLKLFEETKKLEEENSKAWQSLQGQAQAAWRKSTGLPGPAGAQSIGDMIKGGLSQQQQAAKTIIDNAKTAADLQKGNSELYTQIGKKAGDPWAGTNYELAQLDKQKQLYADNADAIAAIEQRKKLLIMQNNMEIAQDAKDKFEKSAQAIESFFQRVFLSAKSFADVWKQLWTQAVGWVVSQFARMVAGWLNAHQQMTGIVGGGNSGMIMGGGATGMGIASAGLGALSPGGMFSGSGGYADGSSLGSTSDLGNLIFGGGAGSTGGGGFSSNPLFNPGGGLSNLGLVTSGGSMAGMLLGQYGVNKGNPILGGIGGFFGGGFAGMALGSSSLLAGTALGAWAGPIGAGIGLLAGIFLASRKRGQQKQASAAVHQAYLDAGKKALDDFSQHKTAYDAAVGSLTSIYQQSIQQLQGMGGPGQNTISQITSDYYSVLAKMDQINVARGYRAQTIGGLPIPEFAGGSSGIIRTGSGGFLAGLHDGEAVLNPRAAARLGSGNIKSLNAGGSVGGGDTFVIHAMDTRGFADFLKRNRATVVKFMRQEKADGYI